MQKIFYAQSRSARQPLSRSNSLPLQLRFQIDPLNHSGEYSQFEFEHFGGRPGLLGGPYV